MDRPGDQISRELTEAQRRSVAAASDLFEQLLDEVRGRATPRLNFDALLGADGGEGSGPAGLAQMRSAVARAIDLYADLLGETFALYADALEQVLRPGNGSRPGRSSGGGAPVVLTGTPGQEATATVWLHNAASSPLVAAELRMTSLTAHDGGTLGELGCVFSPQALDVAAGSSAAAVVSVRVPADAAPGAYHGLVLASGAPAASVPVLLTVR
jgi:hypothetical protein